MYKFSFRKSLRGRQCIYRMEVAKRKTDRKTMSSSGTVEQFRATDGTLNTLIFKRKNDQLFSFSFLHIVLLTFLGVQYYSVTALC